MVIVCWRRPAVWDEEARTEDLLTAQCPYLQPDPSNEQIRRISIIFNEQYIVRHSVKIQQRSETKYALSNNKFPTQRFAAIACDVAIDLRYPER